MVAKSPKPSTSELTPRMVPLGPRGRVESGPRGRAQVGMVSCRRSASGAMELSWEGDGLAMTQDRLLPSQFVF